VHVRVKIEILNFLNFEILHTSEFVFLFVCLSSFLFFTMVLNFGDNCSTVLAFFAPGDGVNDGSSSWKMDVWL
jgi:hypothetical protein